MTTATQSRTIRVYPIACSARRVGSLPACVALGAADIGLASVDGGWQTITWGRNLSREEADRMAAQTYFRPVQLDGTAEDVYELVIPERMADALKSVLIK